MKNKINIKVGNRSFPATLFENAAAFKLKSMVPLPLTMAELNGNEKYAELPVRLPTDATNPGKIQEGDLMLYGASTLVVFYKSFSTSYSYTKLGKIDNLEGLSAALGSGSVVLSLELIQ